MKIGKWLGILARNSTRRLRTSPASAAKQRLVKDYARQADLHVLIETGTYLGDMIEATQHYFREVHSIELDGDLSRWATRRFRNSTHVHLYQGDSADVLPKILSSMHEPCLFWLDAHYSGGITAKSLVETPIAKELNTILSHPISDHLILIDDAECFIGEHDYPSLEEIRQIAQGRRVESRDGVIRIVPPHPNRAPGAEFPAGRSRPS